MQRHAPATAIVGAQGRSAPLSLADSLLGRAQYAAIRDEWKTRIAMVRALRRVELGAEMSLLFENAETVRHHIHEVLWLEGRFERGLWRHECEEYGRLMPAPGELCATLFVHRAEPHWMRSLAEAIIEGRPVLTANTGECEATAVSIDRHQDADSPVQYLRFRFGSTPPPNSPLTLRLRHGGADVTVRISPERAQPLFDRT